MTDKNITDNQQTDKDLETYMEHSVIGKMDKEAETDRLRQVNGYLPATELLNNCDTRPSYLQIDRPLSMELIKEGRPSYAFDKVALNNWVSGSESTEETIAMTERMAGRLEILNGMSSLKFPTGLKFEVKFNPFFRLRLNGMIDYFHRVDHERANVRYINARNKRKNLRRNRK